MLDITRHYGTEMRTAVRYYTHLLEYLKSRKKKKTQNPPLQHQMLPRMWSNRNSHLFLVGVQNGIVTLEDSLSISKNLPVLLSNLAIALLVSYPPKIYVI